MIKLNSVKTLSELQAEHSKQLQEAEAKPKTAGKPAMVRMRYNPETDKYEYYCIENGKVVIL